MYQRGATREEALAHVEEAISGYLEVAGLPGHPVPVEVSVPLNAGNTRISDCRVSSSTLPTPTHLQDRVVDRFPSGVKGVRLVDRSGFDPPLTRVTDRRSASHNSHNLLEADRKYPPPGMRTVYGYRRRLI